VKITIADRDYEVDVLERARQTAPDHVAIVLPCHGGFPLTRLALDAIERFTDVPYELWVVDNASDPETVRRLRTQTHANLVLNHTAPWKLGGLLARFLPWWRQAGGGSIANAVALELAARFTRAHWMWVMHNDALPARRGWLGYLLGRTDDHVRGVTVRQDKLRVQAMHQSGYLFDFSLWQPLRMSFLPNLPAWDVGDLVTVRLREAGYGLHVCDNLHNRPELRARIEGGHWLADINCDAAFDDAGEIFYLHLGRGTLRSSKPGSDQARELTVDEWVARARANLFTA
jgi:hypothetical protein